MPLPPDEPTTMTNDRETPPSQGDNGHTPAPTPSADQPEGASDPVPAGRTPVEVGRVGEQPAEAAPVLGPAVDEPSVHGEPSPAVPPVPGEAPGADVAGEPGSADEPQDDDADAPEAQERSRGRRAARTAVEWILVIGGALLVAFVVKTFLVQAFWIPSPSMEPTLQTDDRVLANKLADGIGDLNRGDVVVFERLDEGSPSAADSDVKDLIKRVIGLPGDVIQAREGVVYVNGTRLDEPYLDEGTRTVNLDQPFTVPEGHVFVMGDNRGNSHDSRSFGPVPEENIVGRAFVRIWPPSRIGRL